MLQFFRVYFYIDLLTRVYTYVIYNFSLKIKIVDGA
jgi:hypothetical protein